MRSILDLTKYMIVFNLHETDISSTKSVLLRKKNAGFFSQNTKILRGESFIYFFYTELAICGRVVPFSPESWSLRRESSPIAILAL